MRSERQVGGLDDTIIVVSSLRLMGEKTFRCNSDFSSTSINPVFEDLSVSVEGRR